MRKVLLGIVIVLLLAAVGIGAYVAVRLRVTAPSDAVQTGPVAQTPPPVHKTVKVYHVAYRQNKAALQPVEVSVDAGGGAMEAAVRALVERKSGAELTNPIPEGTRLLGLTFRAGLATVNLSREFVNNFSGGSETEGLTVDAILSTLGQFPEVKKVMLMVEGKPLQTLGHLDLSGPLDVQVPTSSQ